jgi:hypothetical protein
MLKDDGPPKETARHKATRKWRNHQLMKRNVEERSKKPQQSTGHEPEIATSLTNDGRIDGSITRFENRFKKEIRTILQGNNDLNAFLYQMSLENRRRILLKEKLRRLKLAQAEQEASNV